MFHKETAATNRQVSSEKWIKKSRAADFAAIAKAKKSADQYAATVEEEAAKQKAKGVFLEKKDGVLTEAFCRYVVISNLLEGQISWFSNQDIDRLVLGLEMKITWQDEEKGVYRLSDDDRLTRLFSIRTEGQFLKIFLIN